MNLHIGERLPGSGPARQPGGYVVTEVVAETPWYGLYAGKKIFYNFDFTHKRLRETDEAEWVDVFLRTIRYRHLDDPAYVRRRRDLARAEVRRVLGGRASNLWPEPIDLLELDAPRDPFAFADGADTEPIAVFARPHGQPLAVWQKDAPPAPVVLGLLAELLEFLRQAHAEGLVLHGLGPAAILVDRQGHAHYLGADAVAAAGPPPAPPIEGGEGRGATDADSPSQAHDRLHALERHPRGFTAPEVFQAGAAVDARADLFAWGCLAYFLLTGESPARIALDQGQPWPRFQDAHWKRLTDSLRALPPAQVRVWAGQLGVRESALASGWPDNFASLARALLDPDPRRRPSSIAELTTWLDAPPPPPPAAALALVTGPGEARIYVDWTGATTGLDMVVRRGVGQSPRTPDDGALIEQGPARTPVADAAVPLTPAPVWYAVFARRNDPEGPLHSAAAVSELVERSSSAILRLAEREAESCAPGAMLPPRLALAFGAVSAVELAQTLAKSSRPAVRGWAVGELDRVIRAGQAGDAVEELLRENVLRDRLLDPEPALRQQAARAILARPQTDDALLRLCRFSGQGNLDDALQTAEIFAGAGLDAAQARRIRDILEGERPADCPECNVQLARRDRAEHLRRVHGYLDVDGSLLARPVALDRLWDKVFVHGDRIAHERILQACGAGHDQIAVYVAAVETALEDRADTLRLSGNGAASDALEPYLRSLPEGPRTEGMLAALLGSERPEARRLAREAWLPILGQKLHAENDARAIRRALDEAGGALLNEKIALCRRLPEVGIDVSAAGACLALLDADRVSACAECGLGVRRGDLETHLRRAHGIFQFRGARGSFAEVRAAMAAAVCRPVPDEAAWQALAELAGDAHGAEADGRLVTWVCHKLAELDGPARPAAVAGLAEVLAQDAAGPRLLPWLLRSWKAPAQQALARHLALEVAARLPPPVDAKAIETVAPLLDEHDLPRGARDHAVIGLMRTTGPSGAAAVALLAAYVAQTGKLRAIDKLQQLEQRIGKTPALDALCARLEDQVRMTCPKCAVEMLRPEMVKHLWERHRLVLDARRVREPGRVLEDWVVEYGLEKDAQILERCRALAAKIDPDGGAVLLERLLLRHECDDGTARADLCARAAGKHASLCPYCFAEAPLPPEAPPPCPVTIDKWHLEGAGFDVSIHERGFFPTLTIDTPRGQLYSGREPGRGVTRNGALMLIAPLVLVLFLLTELLTRSRVPGVVLFIVALGLGLLLGGLVYLLWPARPPGKERLLHAAWEELVPEILEEPTPAGIDFLGGLAEASVGKGDPETRAGVVQYACEKIESRAGVEPAARTALVALLRLSVEDAQTLETDPLPALVEQVERSWRGLLPLAHAAHVLEIFFGKQATEKPRALMRRLEIALCARAFEAGLEIADLADMGRTHPVIAAALGLADLDRLAQLRQVWACQETRPWQKWCKATTVFELLLEPARCEKALARTPDLLLEVRDTDIAVGSLGVWFQEACLTAPVSLQIEARRILEDEGYDLIAGVNHFRFRRHPRDEAAELEGWLHYYFAEFLPALAAWHKRPSGAAGARLRTRNALACPECRRPFLGRLGDVGVRETS